jgi:hypothetical protein
MAFRDLSNKGQSEPDTALGTRLTLGSVEGFENAFPLRLGDAGSPIGHHESDAVRRVSRSDLDLDRCLAMTQRVFEQVPNEAPKESWVAIHGSADTAYLDSL